MWINPSQCGQMKTLSLTLKTVARRTTSGYNLACMTDEQKQRIGKALGRVPSGVFILTARHDDSQAAMLASWVQQAAFDPPTLCIAIAPSRPIASTIRSSGKLAISIIPDSDKSLMKRYARGVNEGEDPFAGVSIDQSPNGSPILRDALAWLEGRLIKTCEFGGDHALLIAEVTDGAILRDGAPFMHVRGNGFHY